MKFIALCKIVTAEIKSVTGLETSPSLIHGFMVRLKERGEDTSIKTAYRDFMYRHISQV